MGGGLRAAKALYVTQPTGLAFSGNYSATLTKTGCLNEGSPFYYANTIAIGLQESVKLRYQHAVNLLRVCRAA